MAALIAEIRRDNGLGVESADPQMTTTLAALRSNLERAIQSLSTELYTKDTHFILEFIQNADDNEYPADATPTLVFELLDRERKMNIRCNETGFTAENVKALCRIGASTKKSRTGYIGEKGIGAKSVFKVAEVVYVSSCEYTFRFDTNDQLGLITPSWTTRYPVQPGWTTFNLHLLSSVDTKVLSADLLVIKPSLLLFLRRLRHLEIRFPFASVKFVRYDVDEDVVSLDRSQYDSISSTRYLIVKHMVHTCRDEKKRAGIEQSEVVLAFPIAQTGEPIIENQDVHAFLPIRSYGLPFIVQADFLTSSNREDIMSDSPWNKTLRDGLMPAFLQALDKFRSRPRLEYDWLRYLPNIFGASTNFFGPLEDLILSTIKNKHILHSVDDVYQLPSQVLILSDQFSITNSSHVPLIPQAYLPHKLRYLSDKYDVTRSGPQLERLGVQRMTNDHFLAGLQAMDISSQSTLWHEDVCRVLLNIWRYAPSRDSIRKLKIFPLCSGIWSSYTNGLYLNSEVTAHIPEDLGLAILASDIPPISYRYRLFREMGAQETQPSTIAHLILRLHSSGPFRSNNQLLSHARFMFMYRHNAGIPPATGLRVWDENNINTRAADVYMDHPDSGTSTKLRDILKPPARFLHTSYLDALDGYPSGTLWYDWLRDTLKVNASPRLVNGILPPELKKFISDSSTQAVLLFLKEYWPSLHSSTTSLSDITVVCDDGVKRKIKETALRRGRLQDFDLHFISTDDPENTEWDFLQNLGVTLYVNGVLYLKRLRSLQQLDSRDAAAVEDTYKQLEARFEDDDNAVHIRNAFKREPLIFSARALSSRRWIPLSDAVWNGPSSMRTKFAIKKAYPRLEKLFRHHLRISDAPSDILLQEMRLLGKSWTGQPIPSDIQEQILGILRDVSRAIEHPQGASSRWLPQLPAEIIFPVSDPLVGLTLRKLTDTFYIPDPSGRLATLFQDDVPILALTDTPLHVIQAILTLPNIRDRLRHLDEHVTRTQVAHGTHVPDVVTAPEYISRASYVERLMHATPSAQDALPFLPKFLKLRVFEVDSIEVTFVLGGLVKTSSEEVLIDEDFSVFFSMACEDRDLAFCTELARRLHVETSKLLTILCMPLSRVDAFMLGEGIAPLVNAKKYHDIMWLQESRTEEPTSEEVSDSIEVVNDESSTSPLTINLHDLPGFDEGIAMVAKVATKHTIDVIDVQIARPSKAHSIASLIAQVREHPESQPGRPAQTTREKARSALTCSPTQSIKTAETTMSELKNGILGEFFMYNVFKNELPEFGLDSWTSELRGQVPGIESYAKPSLADFTYVDCQGVLTEKLFGSAKKDAWCDQWPTYYLEVKATTHSKGGSQLFHMSKHQLEIAADMTLRAEQVPETVYAVIRVANIRTNPSYKIYVDPHHQFYVQSMIIASAVEVLVPSASSQDANEVEVAEMDVESST